MVLCHKGNWHTQLGIIIQRISVCALVFCFVCVCVRVSDSLELELQTVVSCMWVLGIEPGSFGRTVNLLTSEPSLQPLA